MKTLAIYLLLCVGLFAQATKVGGSGGTKVGGSGGTKVTGAQISVLKDTFGDAASNENVGDVTNFTYVAGNGDVTSSYTLTSVTLSLKTVGASDPSISYTVYIYGDTGSHAPNSSSLLATSTDTRAWNTLTSSYADYTFAFAGLSVTNGTRYWFAVVASGVNGTNYIQCRISNSVTANTTRWTYFDANGSGAWSLDWDTRCLYVRTYGY